MPTISVIFNDLQRLVGVKLPMEMDPLNEILSFAKGEVEAFEEDELSIEIKDGNRPDLWSVEGIARELRGALKVEEGIREYSIDDYSGVEVLVDSRLKEIRPYIASSVVTAVNLDDDVIRELMHLQEKLDLTYGRKRQRTSIGLYNYDQITPPISYSSSGPEEISFTPLDSERVMSLREILESHPKGLEYGNILKEHSRWPILVDAKGSVLSFPPIINSNDLGRITKGVKDIFVEVTGTVYTTVLNTVMFVTLSLADRGEKILSTRIRYPYGMRKDDETPRLETRKFKLLRDQIRQVLGLDLTVHEIVKLLKRARYDARKVDHSTIEVTVPCYRIDVMHPVDLIEDIAIMYGYNNINPRWPRQITFGKMSDNAVFFNLAREIMIGLSFQEILSYSMSNKNNLFGKMNVAERAVIEISNPMTSRFTCIRSWLMPSLMEFLSSNTSVYYPQKIFEIGKCVTSSDNILSEVKETTKLACITIHPNANFSEIKSILDTFFTNVGATYKIEEIVTNTFIQGRVGEIIINNEDIGVIGEVNPMVLEAWKLENPAACFEIDLEKAFGKILKKGTI